ncbi:Mitogen-activated protein kinase kinase 1 [Hibiscus syriacus]|uniref:mitogen-activated protein kinase kinase n=1 Tax=Hibiscus syriacus TaxID=106335 RepID=A0A6A2XX44_HIBSY|nr:Mitogen-activated protein kinase kinase 1 [Hibiscus syriacus]
MMKKGKGILNPNLNLSLPPPAETCFDKFLTQSGTFKDGDFLVNKYGVRIISQSEPALPQLIKPSEAENEDQLNLEDSDVIKVIGKEINSSIVDIIVVPSLPGYSNEHRGVATSRLSIRRRLNMFPNRISQQFVSRTINHRGEVKITDFGVSAIMTNTSGLASTFVGTYNYMSPERISGSNYGNKSDIWRLGLVLLKCATGQFPYSPPDQAEGWTNFFELMEHIVQQPLPCAPSDQYSSEFCSFISALQDYFLLRDTLVYVQKDPKERKSAHELLVLKHPDSTIAPSFQPAFPFLNMYDDLDVDLSSYLYNAGLPLTPL